MSLHAPTRVFVNVVGHCLHATRSREVLCAIRNCDELDFSMARGDCVPVLGIQLSILRAPGSSRMSCAMRAIAIALFVHTAEAAVRAVRGPHLRLSDLWPRVPAWLRDKASCKVSVLGLIFTRRRPLECGQRCAWSEKTWLPVACQLVAVSLVPAAGHRR